MVERDPAVKGWFLDAGASGANPPHGDLYLKQVPSPALI